LGSEFKRRGSVGSGLFKSAPFRPARKRPAALHRRPLRLPAIEVRPHQRNP